jgi:hypothetical protein
MLKNINLIKICFSQNYIYFVNVSGADPDKTGGTPSSKMEMGNSTDVQNGNTLIIYS